MLEPVSLPLVSRTNVAQFEKLRILGLALSMSEDSTQTDLSTQSAFLQVGRTRLQIEATVPEPISLPLISRTNRDQFEKLRSLGLALSMSEDSVYPTHLRRLEVGVTSNSYA